MGDDCSLGCHLRLVVNMGPSVLASLQPEAGSSSPPRQSPPEEQRSQSQCPKV